MNSVPLTSSSQELEQIEESNKLKNARFEVIISAMREMGIEIPQDNIDISIYKETMVIKDLKKP